MKVGDKCYCIRTRFHDFEDSSSKIINNCGNFYEIKVYNPDFDANTIWLDNETHESGYFYVLRDGKRAHYIFSDYFISLSESRKIKLNRLKLWK